MDTMPREATEVEGTLQRKRSGRPRRAFSAGDRLALTIGTALVAAVIVWCTALTAQNAMHDRAVLEGRMSTASHRH